MDGPQEGGEDGGPVDEATQSEVDEAIEAVEEESRGLIPFLFR